MLEKNALVLGNKLDIESFCIETEHLLLRPVSLEDAELIFKEFDDEITKFMFPSAPESILDTKKFIEESTSGFLLGVEIIVAILSKDNLEYFGNGGIHHINTKTPELGIWIKKAVHGNHYGKEAVAGLVKWADENLNYEYLKYPVALENIPSRKIAEALGGKEESASVHLNQKGLPLNMIEYRIYSAR